MHTIRRDGSRGGTDDRTCRGFVLAAEVEMPPASELQRRLDAVLALHAANGDDGLMCVACGRAWPCLTVHAARGRPSAATEEVAP